MPCSHEDFELTITDAGVCYTFNPRINAHSIVKASGRIVDKNVVVLLKLQGHNTLRGLANTTQARVGVCTHTAACV